MSVYHLVHVVTGGEFMVPLVSSQLFDQAQSSAESNSPHGPESVSVWILEPMRRYFEPSARQKLRELRARCPLVQIRITYGVGRLNDWPMNLIMSIFRRKLGNEPVVFHCRGESAMLKLTKLKEGFPEDRFHLDVRGHWPSERLYRQGVEVQDKEEYLERYFPNEDDAVLSKAIIMADSVNTVSIKLKELLIETYGANGNTYIVPNSVKRIENVNDRNFIRNALGVSNEDILVVYSGNAAPYQHLPDVVIPFAKELVAINHVHFLFLSHQKDEIKKMLQGHEEPKFYFYAAQQKDVVRILTGCDFGLMLREPSLVNMVSNPVKLSEYFSAGVPVFLQKEVGGIDRIVEEYEAGLVINLFDENRSFKSLAQSLYNWVHEKERKQVTANCLKLVSENLLWKNNVEIHFRNYRAVLTDLSTN